MSIFSRLYEQQLNEEISAINEFTTWNPGLLTTNYAGSNFFKASGMNPTQRHRKVIKDPGFRKYAQTVPDMHKVDPKSLQMMGDLKLANSGRKALSQTELQKICAQYGISRLTPTTPKSLGNTGIVLKFDPNLQGYILEK